MIEGGRGVCRMSGFISSLLKKRHSPTVEEEASQMKFGLARVFKYEELKKATNSFNTELGKGGYGKVYFGHDREPRGPNASRDGCPNASRDGLTEVLPRAIAAISLFELIRLTDNFGKKALIGEGSYCRVFSATLSTEECVAMKKLFSNASQEPDNDFSAQFLTVSRLKHEHFVQLLGYCSESKNRILVYEFATRGSLHDVLHGRERVQFVQPHPTLSWSQRIKIAYGAARGLQYLHHEVQPPLVHGQSNPATFSSSVTTTPKLQISTWLGSLLIQQLISIQHVF